MAQKPQTLYLIDGHAQLYRAYHAIRPMFAKDRTPTHAVFGFGNIIRSLRTRNKPELLAAVFDPHGPVKREEVYNQYAEKLGKAFSGYKSQRDSMPDDLRPQIDLAYELCVAYGIPAIRMDGYEADDVLGTLARLAKSTGLDVVIVSGDKDLLQLVDDKIKVFDPMKDIMYDADTVLALKGILPGQIVDWLGFMGDSTDNIPGVSGVGEQTAVRLLQAHGSMDQALEHYQKEFASRKDEVLAFVTAHEADCEKPKEQRAGIKPPKGVKVVDAYLFAQQERAVASRELAKLNTELPLTLDLEALRCKPPKAAMLAPLLRRLDFNKFLEDINQDDLANYEAEAAAAAAKAAPHPQIDARYDIIDTDEKFDAFCKQWKQQKSFAIDTETTSSNPRNADLLGISVSWKAHEAHYLAVHGPLGADKLDLDKTLACMKDVLEDAKIEKVGHHLKYDIQVFRRYGIAMRGIAFDTLIAGWLLDPGAQRLTLDELAYTHLQKRKNDRGKPAKEQLELISIEDVGRNACQDADCTWQLAEKFRVMLEEAGLEPLAREIEIPLIQVLADMESTGIRVDGDLLRKMSANLEQQLAAQETDIYELAGEKFNINSTRQLGDILFEKLGLESKGKTSTGKNSTSEEVLTLLAKDHELPRRILEFRGMQKLKSTYLDALPQMISTRTGRIHCTFHQTGAETGRISSNDPNLQNIPIRSELGRSIRAAFKPGLDGWRILAADYSQIELRILAHYSEDKALIQAFEDGTDIHTAVAARLFSAQDVSREQRSRAKAVNFGIIYGQTAFGLSGVLNISRTEAQSIIDTYFANHPGVRQCIDSIIKKARETGYVTTVMGRRRFVNEINASDRANRALGERLAVNTVFQGSAADLIKKAMIDIHRELKPASALNVADAGDKKARSKSIPKKDWQSNMLLQIHDELLFESPADEAQHLSDLVKAKMEGALELRVPLVVDVGIGDDWLSAKD